MNMKAIFNNTNINLYEKLPLERYYRFLMDNIEIFSMNGKYIENNQVKFIDTTVEANEKDIVINGYNNHISINSGVHKSLLLLSNLKKDISNNNRYYDCDGFSFKPVALRLYECQSIESNTIVTPYIYGLEFFLDKDDMEIPILIPFIMVSSQDSIKLMVLPFANKIASYEKDERIRLFDIDINILSQLIDHILSECTTNDLLFTRLIGACISDSYVYRSNDKRLEDTLNALRMDTKLLKIEYDSRYHYPDMPIIQINPNNPKEIDYILTTDMVNYNKSKFNDFYSTCDLKAIVVRYNPVDFSAFRVPLDIDDEIATTDMIYRSQNVVVYNDDKFTEEAVYIPTRESSGMCGLMYYHNIIASGENELVDNSELKEIDKVNPTIGDSIKSTMEKGNTLIRDISREKRKIVHAKYVNEFLRGVSETVFSIIVAGGLAIFLNPFLSIIGGVLTFVIRAIKSREVDEREYNMVKKGLENEIMYFEAKRRDYEDNPTVLARIDAILDKYRKELEELENARNRKKIKYNTESEI